MSSPSRRLALVIVVVACLVGSVGHVETEPQPDPAPPQLVRYYRELLNGKQRMGFAPDSRRYWAVYKLIRNEGIDTVPDAQLARGVRRELCALFLAAGQPLQSAPADLHLPYAVRLRDFPDAIVWFAACHGLAAGLDDPAVVFYTPDEYGQMGCPPKGQRHWPRPFVPLAES